jgi:hypothetical protein
VGDCERTVPYLAQLPLALLLKLPSPLEPGQAEAAGQEEEEVRLGRTQAVVGEAGVLVEQTWSDYS